MLSTNQLKQDRGNAGNFQSFVVALKDFLAENEDEEIQNQIFHELHDLLIFPTGNGVQSKLFLENLKKYSEASEVIHVDEFLCTHFSGPGIKRSLRIHILEAANSSDLLTINNTKLPQSQNSVTNTSAPSVQPEIAEFGTSHIVPLRKKLFPASASCVISSLLHAQFHSKVLLVPFIFFFLSSILLSFINFSPLPLSPFPSLPYPSIYIETGWRLFFSKC